MCKQDTVPAISASIPTHPIVVRRIHRSARPVTPALPPAQTHPTATIGFKVRSPLGHQNTQYFLKTLHLNTRDYHLNTRAAFGGLPRLAGGGRRG
jgi:hypothetical protein